MTKVEFKYLNEVVDVIKNLKKGDNLKLYFEDMYYDDYFRIKEGKVYNRFREVEFESIDEFIEEQREIEFDYYIIY